MDRCPPRMEEDPRDTMQSSSRCLAGGEEDRIVVSLLLNSLPTSFPNKSSRHTTCQSRKETAASFHHCLDLARHRPSVTEHGPPEASWIPLQLRLNPHRPRIILDMF